MVDKVDTHVQDGTDLLIDAFRRRAKFVAYQQTFLTQIQELEDAVFDVIAKQSVIEVVDGFGTAEGVFLDMIGRIVGEERQDKTDADYLPFIRAKVRANRSDGKINELIEILALILPDLELSSFDLTYSSLSTMRVFVNSDLTSNELDAVRRFMLLAVEATVDLRIQYNTDPPENTFSFSSTYAASETDNDTGWGSSHDPAVGGYFGHLVEVTE